MKWHSLIAAWGISMNCVISFGGETAPALPESSPMQVYIGTYTGAKSKGIYVSRFDPATGILGQPELAVETPSPSFLALHPHGRFIYAVGETSNFGGKNVGSVSAFAIEPGTGKLKLINQKPSGGGGPCHLSLNKDGRLAFVANYGSGSIAVLPVSGDGSLGDATEGVQHHGSSVNTQRQSGPHAHFIIPDPTEKFLLTCDLGLDKILVYRFTDGLGKIAPNMPPSASTEPGAGPRHLAFSPNGQWAYLINEMGSTLSTLQYDASRGTLTPVQTLSTLPPNFQGNNSCAEVQVHPTGKFVYGSNRGADSLAIFGVDSASGKLSYIGTQSTGGKTPRHFVMDLTGNWLLAENQDSDSINIFRIDLSTGRLSPTGQSVSVGAPVCAVFRPSR